MLELQLNHASKKGPKGMGVSSQLYDRQAQDQRPKNYFLTRKMHHKKVKCYEIKLLGSYESIQWSNSWREVDTWVLLTGTFMYHLGITHVLWLLNRRWS